MIDNFHNVSLELELGLGAHVKVMYHTKVIRMREGEEDRIGEWQDALRSFDIAPALRDQTDLDYLIAFFRSRLGPVFVFKMRDPTDFEAERAYFGTGTGSQTVFQLAKNYTSGLPGDTHTTIRPIILPDANLVVYADGASVDDTLYMVSGTEGIVTFTVPPADRVVLTWSGTFQVPVRFFTTQLSTSYAMYQRFDTHIMLVEERVPVHSSIITETEPIDFEEVLFPPGFAERSESGPQYDSIIITGASGVEERLGQFLAPKITFDVEHALETFEDMQALLHFFHARRGRFIGFLALDYTDFQAINEPFAIGDGVTATFSLTKSYTTGGFTQVRPITRLALPVAVYMDDVLVTDVRVVHHERGVEVLAGSGDMVVAAGVSTMGVVSFGVPPPAGAVLTWTGDFYVPVRFDTDELDITVEGPDVMTWSRIGLIEIPTTMTGVTVIDVG